MEGRKKLVLAIGEIASPTKTLANENVALLAQDFDLEFWDIRPLNAWWKNNRNAFRFLDEAEFSVLYIRSKDDIAKALTRLKADGYPVAFLVSDKVRVWSWPFFRELKKFDIPYFVRRNKTHPFTADVKFKNIISSRIKSRRRRIVNFLRNQLPVDRLLNVGISRPVKVFAGTRFDLLTINFYYGKQDVVFTHFKDYDHFMRLPLSKSSFPEKFIVYVDQYYPFHPELKELNIAPDTYYPALCSFLNKLSAVTRRKIVICVHPITDPLVIEKYFAGFEVYRNRTVELLSQAEFGVFHNSSVILSSLFLRKPILLIKADRILPPQINHFNKLFEKLFGIRSVDIEAEVNDDVVGQLLDIQNKSVNELFNNCVKHPGSPEDLEYSIISKHINGNL